MKRYTIAIQIWLLSFLVCTAMVALSFSRADVPIALDCLRFGRLTDAFGEGIGGAILLSIETIAVATLIFARLLLERLPPLAEVLAVACLTSICAYAFNSNVLKVFFGAPNPSAVMRGAEHAFHYWAGSPNSSFPSGHMALAGSFAGVFMRLYRRSVFPLAALLVFGACVLVVGRWHFLSDVIAGTFLGISVGLVAGELWKVHSSQRLL